MFQLSLPVVFNPKFRGMGWYLPLFSLLFPLKIFKVCFICISFSSYSAFTILLVNGGGGGGVYDVRTPVMITNASIFESSLSILWEVS